MNVIPTKHYFKLPSHVKDKIGMVLIGWFVVPCVLIYASLILPTCWLLRYGAKNSPFFHNVRAGWNSTFIKLAQCWEDNTP